jgi:23S rRNA (adenine1618-N6)-methyltransferase
MKNSSSSSIIYGIDIGCGPSCIFGLLMCSLIKNCKMLVTDIDEENIKWAQENVTANNLNERIKSKLK